MKLLRSLLWLALACIYMIAVAKTYGWYMHLGDSEVVRNIGFLLLIATLLPITAFLIRTKAQPIDVAYIEGFLWIVFWAVLGPQVYLPTRVLDLFGALLITGVAAIGAQLALISLVRPRISRQE